MAEITAAMVKELRERTQAGMMDCKKALVPIPAAAEHTRRRCHSLLALGVLRLEGVEEGGLRRVLEYREQPHLADH